MRLSLAFAAACLIAAAAPAAAQTPDALARMAAQRSAMARLAGMNGVWRGPAWSLTPAGRRELIQTERIGPFLGGGITIIEGRGYLPDGSVGFNAYGVISFDPATGAYTLSSWAMGYAGDFPLRVTDTGYVWEIPGGPGTIIRYTATIGEGRWREIGERIVEGAPPLQIFEMNLTRVGDTAWPAGDPVPMR
ncbi:MAG TPA: DUF1579 domain-containing protein [Allosphingosinicella sp.]|nr:DUF1579 domain-containing protein [Allosphingosinicella sp.]